MKSVEYYRAVLLGAVVAVFFLTGFYVFNSEDKPQKPQSNFEVVDHYGECKVIRWTNNQLAEYKYFLDCKK